MSRKQQYLSSDATSPRTMAIGLAGIICEPGQLIHVLEAGWKIKPAGSEPPAGTHLMPQLERTLCGLWHQPVAGE